MTWLEKIQNKPHAEKIRLIWIICGSMALVLLVVWILTSRLSSDLPKDTSLFQTIKQGIKNLDKWVALVKEKLSQKNFK